MLFRFLLILLLMPQFAIAQSVTGPQHSSAPLNVTDGSTSCYPYSIAVTSGSLACASGVATVTTGGGSGAGNVGIGTINYIPQYVGISTLGPSNIVNVAGNVGINSAAPMSRLDISGNQKTSGSNSFGWIFQNLIPNTNTVSVGGYFTIPTTAANVGATSTTQGHLLNKWKLSRIRQNGNLNQIKIYTASVPVQLTHVYFEIWRATTVNDLTSMNQISSEDIISSLVPVTTNTVTLSNPVSVQEGDYTAISWTSSSSPGNFLTALASSASDSTASYSFIDSSYSSISNFNWTSGTSTSSTIIPVQTFVNTDPQIVFIGDSLISGRGTGGGAFIDSNITTGALASPDYTVNFPYQLGHILNLSYQNMGIGGQTTTQIVSRFTNDVVNLYPRIAILEGGINDVANSVAESTFLANWKILLDTCEANNIVPIVLALTPYTLGSTVIMQNVDIWNDDLEKLTKNYRTAIFIDSTYYLGQYRTGGDNGNRWDIIPNYLYSGDGLGIHLSSAGYAEWALGMGSSLSLFQGRNRFPFFTTTTDGLTIYPENLADNIGIGTFTVAANSILTVIGKQNVDTLTSTNIFATGNVGIGTTLSTPNNSNGQKFQPYIKATGTNNFGVGIQNTTATTGATMAYYLLNDTGENTILRTYSSGFSGSFGGIPLANATVLETYGSSDGFVIGTGVNTPLTFIQNAIEKMRINTGGNVGIGTINPAALFNINSSANQDLFRVDDSAGSDATPFIIDQTGNVGIGSANPSAVLAISSTLAQTLFRIDDNGTGDLSPFIIDQNGNVGIGTTNTEKDALLVMGGNVGIGTWVPSTKLDVAGSIVVNSAGNIGIGTNSGNFGLSVMVGNVGIGTFLPSGKLNINSSGGSFLTQQATAPTVASNDCGSTSQGAVVAKSSDLSGSVTVGTLAVTSCAVTFNGTFNGSPNCLCQDDSNVLAVRCTATTTKLTITSTSSISSDVITWFCPGNI